MSAAIVASRSPHHIGGDSTTTTTTTLPSAMAESKRIKIEDKARKEIAGKETRSTTAAKNSASAASVSPKQDTKSLTTNAPDAASTTATTAPLAPPPRPAQSENGSDYFAPSHKNHLSSEPNPFEQSFGNPATETPGKSINLPPVTSLTSPAPLGTGNASLTGGFGWGGSLRSGPLSPAMLSGPQGDYFSDNIRSFPTPNESSLRTGLTPGGGGSMFPAPSPGTQAFFNSAFGSGGQTPGIDFRRAAVNAATVQSNQEATTTTAPATSAATMTASNLAQHSDNEAANGLFMLAQASAPQVSAPYPTNGTTKTTRNNGSISAASNPLDDEEEEDKTTTTRKSKRASAGKNSRRKTEDAPVRQPPPKKSKSNAGIPVATSPDMEDMEGMDSDDMDVDVPKDTRKMTDEEKRKNFLERNRVAALKCRQRKKQWLQNLQSKVEIYSSENDALNAQVTALRDEVLNLKTILVAHKDCPIAQQQASSGAYLQHGVDYGNAHYGAPAYGMGMQQQQQQQTVGMGGGRRAS